jgi:transposase
MSGLAIKAMLARKLLSRVKPGSMLLADRGYEADWRACHEERRMGQHLTQEQSQRFCFSLYFYRARNRIERFFNTMKRCRRVATRYDKLAANYLALVQLASIRLWLRANESTPLIYPASRPLNGLGFAALTRFADGC